MKTATTTRFHPMGRGVCIAALLGISIAAAQSVLAGDPALASQEPALENPRLTNCLVSIKDEVEVPAQEAGVLTSLTAHEGMHVTEKQLLGTIDDSERQMQKRLALIEQAAAKEQAENDINVRYAVAAAKVAQAEYHQSLEANQRVRGTFPEAEVRRLKLAWQRAELQIEQAQVEQRVAKFTAETREAEVEAADQNIQRRRIVAPVEGDVVAVLKHAGEWAQPGEPVLRIVRLDVLRVEGFLNARKFDPADVAERPVWVEVELARGRRVQLPGKIAYVSPIVQAGGEYRVWADVANRQERGQWVLRPGLKATMTIKVIDE